MLRGIDINEVVEYVSKDDKGDNPTRFYIGNISNRAKLELFKTAMDSQGNINIAKLADKMVDIFKAGVKRISNLNGVDYSSVTDEVAEMIPFPVVLEVVDRVMNMNFLGAQEEKN
jgi:hypothetical protein